MILDLSRGGACVLEQVSFEGSVQREAFFVLGAEERWAPLSGQVAVVWGGKNSSVLSPRMICCALCHVGYKGSLLPHKGPWRQGLLLAPFYR